MIEHWNGTQWTVVPSPNPSSTLNVLNAVAAVSANNVWAVGIAPTGSNPILIIHWNGSVWSVVPNPPSSMPLNNLAALAVVSANDVRAVGTGLIGDEDATATLHWNGTAWSVIPSPNVGPEVDNNLAGVTACLFQRRCGGGHSATDFVNRPTYLILHWNGHGLDYRARAQMTGVTLLAIICWQRPPSLPMLSVSHRFLGVRDANGALGWRKLEHRPDADHCRQ